MTTIIPDKPACGLISLAAPVAYHDALRLQYDLLRRRQTGEIGDTLLMLEHAPTITRGRGTEAGDLLTDERALAARGIAVVDVDRGGEITYHAPGQLVGYPILDLNAHGRDLHRYLRSLEETLIHALAEYGLRGERIAGRTGVWVRDAKIAAIGIKVSRWVTMHGFALNIDLDLSPMRRDFIPCGIRDRDVTSLAEQLPWAMLGRNDVEARVVRCFGDVFRVEIAPVSIDFMPLPGIISQ
jgi:lipoyl(octanoyl) transferase